MEIFAYFLFALLGLSLSQSWTSVLKAGRGNNYIRLFEQKDHTGGQFFIEL